MYFIIEIRKQQFIFRLGKKPAKESMSRSLNIDCSRKTIKNGRNLSEV